MVKRGALRIPDGQATTIYHDGATAGRAKQGLRFPALGKTNWRIAPGVATQSRLMRSRWTHCVSPGPGCCPAPQGWPGSNRVALAVSG